MNIQPFRMIQRVRDLPGHLHGLADHLRRLSVRVRESVAEAIGDTVARAVKSVLHRGLSGEPILKPPNRYPDRDDWDYRSAESPWPPDDTDWEGDFESEPQRRQETVDKPSRSARGLCSIALQVAGWWLRRRGSWLGATGLSLLLGGVAVIGGPIAVVGLGVAETLLDLLALQQALAGGAAALSGV